LVPKESEDDKPIPVLNVQQLQEIQMPRKDFGKKKKENKDLNEI
jgi:hypothetical protein